MKGYQEPSFQDRVGRAAEARLKALEKLKAKPPVDEAVLAARREKAEKKEAELAAKRAEKAAAKAAEEAAKALAEEERLAAEAEALAAKAIKLPTAAELKAARDARYAARKGRK
jgi:hypothetical protein